MSIRERYPKARLSSSHYFLTISRGDRVRGLAVRPGLAWAGVLGVCALAAWAGVATALFVAREPIAATLVARASDVEAEYEVKLADARGELDRLASRRLLDANAFEVKMKDLLARQARLEKRGEALAALAAEAGADATALAEARPRAATRVGALAAIQAASGAPTDGDIGAASAFAPTRTLAPPPPVKPRPLDGDTLSRAKPDRLGGELSVAAADATLEPNARVGLVDYSLDRVERAQIDTLGSVAKAARAATQRFETVIDRTGLSASLIKPPEGVESGGVGGPFIPLDAKDDPAFARAAASATREVEAAQRLRRLMPHLPLSYPLSGDATMSSPFGYRPDPFLGRPALHPGVDLVQAYGAEIKATAVGRVTHAGPMGGYGNAVEIDHGGGIATRYGHMSEVLVEEGREVKVGDVIGRIGSTGRSTGPHLHYEVRVDGEPVDPERFLTAARD